MQKGTDHLISKKEAQGLYFKHMTEALDAQAHNDRGLFDSHYQRAEYYLHIMNKLGACWAAEPGQKVRLPQQLPTSPFKGTFSSRNCRKKRPEPPQD